jgi:hypothetical protein
VSLGDFPINFERPPKRAGSPVFTGAAQWRRASQPGATPDRRLYLACSWGEQGCCGGFETGEGLEVAELSHEVAPSSSAHFTASYSPGRAWRMAASREIFSSRADCSKPLDPMEENLAATGRVSGKPE